MTVEVVGLERARLLEILSALVRVPVDRLQWDQNTAAIGLDSLQRVMLVEALEIELESEFNDGTIERLMVATSALEIYQVLAVR